MTDFDLGSVYGAPRSGRFSLGSDVMSRLKSIVALRKAKTVTPAPDQRRDEKAYLADIGMEVGF